MPKRLRDTKITKPYSVFFQPGWVALFIVALLAGLSYFFFFRLDLTSDNRFSISRQSKQLMKSVSDPIEVTVYLDGDLNPGFLRLRKSVAELLDELSAYADTKLSVRFVNPSSAASSSEREANYDKLASRGLMPTVVYERDKEGKSIQKVIFPWIDLGFKNKVISVNLLRNIPGFTAEENLNSSVESLEYELTDGIRRVLNSKIRKIAFIEGHGEYNEKQTYDISKSLSRYFQIDRGKIGNDASILNDYEAIIIASPEQPYSETEKCIIDQYVMNGGNVLWLVDGVRINRETLSRNGLSPAIGADVNLSDQLFRYGVRINPVLLQDVQCVAVPVNIAPAGETPRFESSPWYFNPLLLSSPVHSVTRNIASVRSDFCSAIDLVGANKSVKSSVLLVTSDNTHVVSVPSLIDVSQVLKSNDKKYFNAGYLPVAVALEGNFESAFMNRIRPRGIDGLKSQMEKGQYAKQIVVADADIIRNEISGDSTIVPLGFDRFSNQQFGNKDFILNSVLYLTDDDGWLDLRSRSFKIRMLNKNQVNSNRLIIQLVNVFLPLVLLMVTGICFQLIRRKKYTRK